MLRILSTSVLPRDRLALPWLNLERWRQRVRSRPPSSRREEEGRLLSLSAPYFPLLKSRDKNNPYHTEGRTQVGHIGLVDEGMPWRVLHRVRENEGARATNAALLSTETLGKHPFSF